MKKSLFFAGLLAVSGAFAGSKTYDIKLAVAAKAGATELKAGSYKLKIDGSNAIFTDVKTKQSFTTPAKIATGKNKFEFTALETTDGQVERIDAIDLGGTSTKIEFSNE